MIHCMPNTADNKKLVETTLSKLVELRKRPVVCIYHDQNTNEVIDSNCVDFARQAALQLKPHKQVSILLDSPGGDIEDAYRMLSAFRRHVDNIEVLVPNWAKSAATFFCLGANKILMGPDAELGPLDPQLRDPGGSAKAISPLETFQGLEHLRTYAIDTLDAIVKLFMLRAGMDVPNAIREAQPYVAAIVTPLYQQIDPHEMGELGRHLRVSEEYAIRAMKHWGYSTSNAEHIDDLVRKLVWNYPTHGFVIDLKEARKLGLHAIELDDDADRLCKELLSCVDGCMGLCLPHENTINSAEQCKDDQDDKEHIS